jgi:hypothetical protein
MPKKTPEPFPMDFDNKELYKEGTFEPAVRDDGPFIYIYKSY